MKWGISCLVLTCLASHGPALQASLLEDLLEQADPQGREQLLREAVVHGDALPSNWKALWPEGASHLLQLMDWPTALAHAEENIEAWPMVARCQFWKLALERGGVDHLLDRVPSPSSHLERQWMAKLRGMESSWEAQLQPDGVTKEAKDLEDQLKEDWNLTVIQEVLKGEQVHLCRAVVNAAQKRNFKLSPEQLREHWSRASEPGRRALAALGEGNSSLSPVFRELHDAGQSPEMSLRALATMKAHGASDWLSKRLVPMLEAKQVELLEFSLKLLFLWDEVPKDSRYVDFYHKGNYRRAGGVAANEVLLLMAKSQHDDAIKPILYHTRESEKNPYTISKAIEAMGYHGSSQFLSFLNKQGGGRVVDWAIGRISGSHSDPYRAPERILPDPKPRYGKID